MLSAVKLTTFWRASGVIQALCGVTIRLSGSLSAVNSGWPSWGFLGQDIHGETADLMGSQCREGSLFIDNAAAGAVDQQQR